MAKKTKANRKYARPLTATAVVDTVLSSQAQAYPQSPLPLIEEKAYGIINSLGRIQQRLDVIEGQL